MRYVCCGLLWLVLFSGASRAAPTILVGLPTPDILGRRNGEFAPREEGEEHEWDAYIGLSVSAHGEHRPCTHDIQASLSLASDEYWEIDYDFGVADAVDGKFGAKYEFDHTGNFRATVGVDNMALAVPTLARPYLVGREALGKWSLRGGIRMVRSRAQAFGGLSYKPNLKGSLTWMTGYSAGPTGSLTAGLRAGFGEGRKYDCRLETGRKNRNGEMSVSVSVGRCYAP